jgi:hypothetical protein
MHWPIHIGRVHSGFLTKQMSDSLPPISQNPTPKDLLKSMEGAAALKWLYEVAGKIGLKHDGIAEALMQVPELIRKTNELVHLPDRFNQHFASRGWIAHESQNIEVSQAAIDLADQGEMERAEQLLTEHYDEKALDFVILRCRWSEAFRVRWDLAQAAKSDYLEGRYYSAVPLVLMLIDGFVNDIEQTGFFTDRTDLTAWDSIAAHSSGLTKLSEIFGASRTKTTTDPISLPYRNGILHGRDLGYGNRLVAAKTWAALSAVADWATAVRNGKKQPKEKAPTPSLLESFQKLAEVEERKRHLSAWKARNLVIGGNLPASGQPSDYQDGSPEHAIACLFDLWSKKNYGKMAFLLYDFGRETPKQRAGEIRSSFGLVELQGFQIKQIEDIAPGATTACVVVRYVKSGVVVEKEVALRLLYQNESDEPRVYPHEKAAWVIMVMGFNELLYSR